jgi:hypothetical protein
VEIAVGMTVFVIAILGFSRALISSMQASQKTRELDRATQAANQMLERMEAEAFADVFRRFNADPADDPGGAGTAPGASFAVEGLSALSDDPDGLAGEVIFPVQVGAPSQLREDAVLPEIGMPRDLDGDGVIDAANHAVDYTLLPVLIRVRWRSASGPGTLEVETMLGNY